MDSDAVKAMLRQLLYKKHGSVESFFDTVKDKDGQISRKGFKKALQNLGLDLNDAARKVKVKSKSKYTRTYSNLKIISSSSGTAEDNSWE